MLHNLADPIPARNLPDPYRTRGGSTCRVRANPPVRVIPAELYGADTCVSARIRACSYRCAAHRGHCERVFTRAYLLLAGNDTADSDVACRKCFPPSALCRHMLFRRRQESSSTTRAEATAVNYYLPRCFLMGHSADASSDSRQAVRELLAETSL